jgi:hypothetical protein
MVTLSLCSKALQMGITKNTNADGGQIEIANGEPTEF